MTNKQIQTQDLSAQIEGDFIALLDDYFSLPETWNDELDRRIATWYSKADKVWPKRDYLYFSPSSLGDCPREMFIKAKYGNKVKDNVRDKPWRGRQRKLGTLGGDLVQRSLLDIEDNYGELTGNIPRFKFVKNDDGTPLFEDFSGVNKLVEMGGEKFYLYGFTDGIMEYITDDGEIIRVGLEVKSKQNTPARTSLYSMRQPDSKHAQQVVAYSEMYDVDYFIILYVNYAKQGWDMTDEQYAKTPDIRAFCAKITDEHKRTVFDKAVKVTRAVRENKPPKLDIDEWTFNNFKRASAESLTDEEFEELRQQAERARHSSMPARKIESWARAVDEIEELRKESD